MTRFIAVALLLAGCGGETGGDRLDEIDRYVAAVCQHATCDTEEGAYTRAFYRVDADTCEERMRELTETQVTDEACLASWTDATEAAGCEAPTLPSCNPF